MTSSPRARAVLPRLLVGVLAAGLAGTVAADPDRPAGSSAISPSAPADSPTESRWERAKRLAREAADSSERAARAAGNASVAAASAAWQSTRETAIDAATLAEAWASDSWTRARGFVEDARNRIDAAARAARPATGAFLLLPPDPAKLYPLSWRPITLDSAEPLPARVVVLVHGLDEAGSVWSELAPVLHWAHHAVVRVDYLNDQPIATSADDLAAALRLLRSRGVQRVDLVCHSMGGLIARDVLTRDAYYAGIASGHGAPATLPAVERVIVAGTPNAGSVLAYLQPASDAFEHARRALEARDPAKLLGILSDGRGEAGGDLLPGSPYLAELSARPAPTGVRATVIVGQLVPVTREDVLPEWAAQAIGPDRADSLAAAIIDVAENIGDGIVPEPSVITHGWAGPEDIVRVRASHRSMLQHFAPETAVRSALGMEYRIPPAIPVIMDRLAR